MMTKKPPEQMTIGELQQEIAYLQSILQHKICGDSHQRVTCSYQTVPSINEPSVIPIELSPPVQASIMTTKL